MRIEATEGVFAAVEDKIREVIPEKDRQLIVDNIGLPARAYNLAFTDGSTIGANDGVIMVSLKEGHAPTADYVRKLREVLPTAFPDVTFYFQAADIVTQILNFGLPAQIDVRTIGQDRATNLNVAKELQRRIAAIPGIADAHLQQEVDSPAFQASIDRTRAAKLGLNANTIAQHQCELEFVSSRSARNLDRSERSGIPYYIAVQTPDYGDRLAEKSPNTPVSTAVSRNGESNTPACSAMSSPSSAAAMPTNSNQTNIQPVYEVYASVQGRDLGGVATEIKKIVNEAKADSSSLQYIAVAGQIESMEYCFRDLVVVIHPVRGRVRVPAHGGELSEFRRPAGGAACAAGDILRHPGHAVITGTTLSVPSLMGAIMAVGVASANSILLVTFAHEQQQAGKSSFEAARERRPYEDLSGADDGSGHDRRHDPDGDRWRRRGAECGAGPRGYRRTLFATATTLLVVPYLFARAA